MSLPDQFPLEAPDTTVAAIHTVVDRIQPQTPALTVVVPTTLEEATEPAHTAEVTE